MYNNTLTGDVPYDWQWVDISYSYYSYYYGYSYYGNSQTNKAVPTLLSTMNLHGNQISGTAPAWLDKIMAVNSTVDFSYNMLSGRRERGGGGRCAS